MTSHIQDRIRAGNGGVAVLASDGTPVSEALARLESGEVLAGGALDLAALVAFEAFGADDSLGPALVRSEPLRPGLIAASSESALMELLPKASRTALLALSAGLLQVLDAWEASHEAAQAAEDLGERRFSAYWHGIAHRREPDSGNASYWFRRVGRHPLFDALGTAARETLDRHGATEATRRVVAAGWDPAAMIDVCTRTRRGDVDEAPARRLQRVEMSLLLDATVVAATA